MALYSHITAPLTSTRHPLTAQTGIFKVIPTQQQAYHRVEVGWNNAETHAASALAMRKGPFGRVRISHTGCLHT